MEIEEKDASNVPLKILLHKIPKKTITITMPEPFLDIIDEKKSERIGLSRNAWILEAIQEKIEKSM